MRYKLFFFALAVVFNSVVFAQNGSSSKMPFDEKNEFVLVEGGLFIMGDKKGDDDEHFVHWVEISSFYIMKSEVTTTQYAAFLNSYDSETIKEGHYRGMRLFSEALNGVRKVGNKWKPQPGFENHPMVHVTWYGAYEFCKHYGYRLPTEAEWEFAARGGKESRSFKYAGGNNIGKVSWYAGNSAFTTQPIGQKLANELGLFDMSGNVAEWCSDWYDPEYYTNSDEVNPQGPKKGEIKVLRGGSWGSIKKYLSLTGRFRDLPANSNSDYGFRAVKDISK